MISLLWVSKLEFVLYTDRNKWWLRPENGRFRSVLVIFCPNTIHISICINYGISVIECCCLSSVKIFLIKLYHRIFNLAYIQCKLHFFPHFGPNYFPELFLGTEWAKITWKKVSCWPQRVMSSAARNLLIIFCSKVFFCFIHYSTYRHIGNISWEEISDKDFFSFFRRRSFWCKDL